jgi:hypothetical protein
MYRRFGGATVPVDRSTLNQTHADSSIWRSLSAIISRPLEAYSIDPLDPPRGPLEILRKGLREGCFLLWGHFRKIAEKDSRK